MEQQSPRHQELIDRGWTRRFSAGRARLDEAATMYRELGLDVILEPPDPGAQNGSCANCAAGQPDDVRVIYTRP